MKTTPRKGVKGEDHDDRQAGRSCLFDSEGGLTDVGGRPARGAGRPTPSDKAIRLKRSVECFAAANGALYLLRSGAAPEFVLEHPTPADRELLTALSSGFHSCDQ